MAYPFEEIEWDALSAAAPDESTDPQVASMSPPCGNSAGGSDSLSPAAFDARTLAQTISNLFGRHFQRDRIDDEYDDRGEREYRLRREQ